MEAAVNTWLEHWVGRQGRGKLPLMLIDPSTHPGVKAVPQTSSNKGKKRMDWVEPDDNADDEVNEDDTSNGGEQSGERSESPAPSGTYSERRSGGPPAPGDHAETRRSRREFLRMLSEDVEYRRLLVLLDRAKV
jgi:hypothetical protein